MKKYFLHAFLTASLAYSLFFLFTVAYDQPLGASDIVNAYGYGFIIHMPLWMAVLLVGGIFNEAVFKRNTAGKIIKISLCAILVMLLIPALYSNVCCFDFLNLLFYTFDFIFCYFIFVKLLQRD